MEKRPRVNLAIPLKFMKKGESGYIASEHVPIVIKEGSTLSDLKLQCYLYKRTGVCKIPVEGFPFLITKVGDGFTISDFVLSFDESIVRTPFEYDDFSSWEEFKDGNYLGPIDVDWYVAQDQKTYYQNLDLSTFSFLELVDMINQIQEINHFTMHKEFFYSLFDYIPAALKIYLSQSEDGNLSFLEQYWINQFNQNQKSIDNPFKTFVLKVDECILNEIRLCITERTKPKELVSVDLASLSKDELEREYNQAIAREDYEGANIIKQYMH